MTSDDDHEGETVAKPVEHVDDELEPFTGRYNWEETFRQNPDQGRFDVPRWMRDQNHGTETAEDAQARASAEEAEEWLAIVADAEGLEALRKDPRLASPGVLSLLGSLIAAAAGR